MTKEQTARVEEIRKQIATLTKEFEQIVNPTDDEIETAHVQFDDLSNREKYEELCDNSLTVCEEVLNSRNSKAEDRKEILDDFKQWSGGFAPAECDEEQIKSYLDFGRADNVDPYFAAEVLEEARDNK